MFIFGPVSNKAKITVFINTNALEEFQCTIIIKASLFAKISSKVKKKHLKGTVAWL